MRSLFCVRFVFVPEWCKLSYSGTVLVRVEMVGWIFSIRRQQGAFLPRVLCSLAAASGLRERHGFSPSAFCRLDGGACSVLASPNKPDRSERQSRFAASGIGSPGNRFCLGPPPKGRAGNNVPLRQQTLSATGPDFPASEKENLRADGAAAYASHCRRHTKPIRSNKRTIGSAARP